MFNGHKIFLTTRSPQELIAHIDDTKDGVGGPRREHVVKVWPRKPAGK